MPEYPSDTFAHHLFESYEQYKELSLSHRRFKHDNLVPLIDKLGEHPVIEVIHEGNSPEGRGVYRLKAGTGDISVLLWTQMHGNEPTATMAVFDVFNFLTAEDENDNERSQILEHLTIHAVPMLNPDGAERYKRRTAFGIDMNRDALQLQSPESRILKGIRDELDADFGFNLHDQSICYSVGDTPKSTIIAFLAPACDKERRINPVRQRGMQLIAQLDKMLQQYIPGHVAAYSDAFEPRAFGDNMQKWGTSTILIESGGMPGDPEKQYIRKLNYLLLLESFRSIASTDYQKYTVEQYNSILPNSLRLYSVIFRNVTIAFDGHEFDLDLAVNRSEVNINRATGFYERGIISELGDLSTFNGYEEIDETGLRAEAGRVYPDLLAGEEDLEAVDTMGLIRQGYTAVRLDAPPDGRHTEFPMNILGPNGRQPAGPVPGRAANLVFYRGDEVVYAVINGFVVDVTVSIPEVGNALIYH